MIELKNASFSYGAGSTVRDLSFTIDAGEFIAILGANGAGSVLINGKDTAVTRVSERARQVGFLFQNPDQQICRNTVREEIAFGLTAVRGDLGEDGIRARTDEMLREFGFTGEEEPFSLSRGQRQLVALASVLAVQPEVIILDEPTTGLDYLECTHIMEMISRMNREQQMTVIMVCHDMEVVLDYARRALIISDGQLIADGPVEQVFRDEALLARSSILPPQIIGLSLRLRAGFEQVTTAEEAAEAVLRLRTGKEAAE